MEKKKEGIVKQLVGILVKVFNWLPNLYWWYILLFSGSFVGVGRMFLNNPFVFALFWLSLPVAGFAIIAIVINLKEKKKREKKYNLPIVK